MPALYRVYRTNLTFSHVLPDRPEVVDKACLMNHAHSDRPLTIKLMSGTFNNKWVDFKTIKEKVEIILDSKYRTNLGEMDVETIVENLARDIAFAFSLNLAQVKIHLQESDRYGISLE